MQLPLLRAECECVILSVVKLNLRCVFVLSLKAALLITPSSTFEHGAHYSTTDGAILMHLTELDMNGLLPAGTTHYRREHALTNAQNDRKGRRNEAAAAADFFGATLPWRCLDSASASALTSLYIISQP